MNRIIFILPFLAILTAATTTITTAVYASFSLSTGEDIETTQDEFARNMEEAMEEVQREETAELFGGEENVPTVDEFMEGVEAEGEFDDEQEAAEFEENGIELDGETGEPISPVADLNYYDTKPKITLFNQTFEKILNNATTAAPEIEVEEVQIDVDEGEEEDSAQRQIMYYEFDPANPDDDIRIYTTPDQTVQSISNLLTTYINFVRVDLYEDGRAVIYCDGESAFDEADDTRIYAPHTFTPANGYRFDDESGQIYDGNLNMSIHSQLSPPFDVFTSPEAMASQC